MSILQCKSATLYKYTRDTTTKISSYGTTWIDIPCSIQPASTSDWLEWETLLNTYRFYSDYTSIDVWDKIVVLWRTFIVNSVQQWNWLKRQYVKCFINESIGTN